MDGLRALQVFLVRGGPTFAFLHFVSYPTKRKKKAKHFLFTGEKIGK